MNYIKTNPSEGVSNQTSEIITKYYQIRVWVDEELRDLGHPVIIKPHFGSIYEKFNSGYLFNGTGSTYEYPYPKEWDFNSIDEIKTFVEGLYNTNLSLYTSYYHNDPLMSIKDGSGSIEIDEIDESGKLINSLYHISVDSNHELEELT